MQEIEKFLQTWAVEATDNDRKEFLNGLHFNSTWSEFSKSCVDLYIHCIFDHLEHLGFRGGQRMRDIEAPASALVFFIWSFTFAVHFPNWVNHLEALFNYNLLYLYVDHYIDDTEMTPEQKKTSISQMFILLQNPRARFTLPLVDPTLSTIAELYEGLATKYPQSVEAMKAIFKTQIEGLKYQNDPNSSKSDLEDICVRKGSRTAEVIATFVGLTPTDAWYRDAQTIGAIMQLVDDCIDVEADLKNNVSTIATWIFREHGSLDSLLITIAAHISEIGNHFWMFKISYTLFLCYIPDRWARYFSPEIRSLFHRYNLFDYNLGCDGVLLLTNMVLERIKTIEIKLTK